MEVIPIPGPVLQTANILATMRYESNVERGSAMQHHYYEIKDVERDGLLAEMAFAMWLGIWPSNVFSTSPDHGIDYVVNGWRVDVKGTSLKPGGLIGLQHKRISKVDIFTLVIVSPKVCRLVGWAWARELLRSDNLRDLGKTTEHYIYQSQLQPMVELRQVLRTGRPK